MNETWCNRVARHSSFLYANLSILLHQSVHRLYGHTIQDNPFKSDSIFKNIRNHTNSYVRKYLYSVVTFTHIVEMSTDISAGRNSRELDSFSVGTPFSFPGGALLLLRRNRVQHTLQWYIHPYVNNTIDSMVQGNMEHRMSMRSPRN